MNSLKYITGLKWTTTEIMQKADQGRVEDLHIEL